MTLKAFFTHCALWLGIEKNQTSHHEKLISGIGALLGIFASVWVSIWLVHTGVLTVHSSILVIASLGATSVLIFAVPHGALSQPWHVLAGHLISGFVGVTCQKLVGVDPISAGIAVGLAVTLMYYFRCIHPPGGATALTAIVGGPDIVALGYSYLIYPLLLNLVVILAVAIVFNNAFHWRRYPVHLKTKWSSEKTKISNNQKAINEKYELTTEDFNAAIREHDSFIDVTEEGLSELLELAKQHAMRHAEHPKTIEAGHYYSNGEIGKSWCVRYVLEVVNTSQSHSTIIYETVCGDEQSSKSQCEKEDFRQWARFEVIENKGGWVKRYLFE